MAEQRTKGKSKEILDAAQAAATEVGHRLKLGSARNSGPPMSFARYMESLLLLPVTSERARNNALMQLEKAYKVAAEEIRTLKYSEKSFIEAKTSHLHLLRRANGVSKKIIEFRSKEYSNGYVKDDNFRSAINKVRKAFHQRAMAEAGLDPKRQERVTAEDAISELAAVFGLSVTISATETTDPILSEILKSDLERWDTEPLRVGRRAENASQFVRRVYDRWLSADGQHQLTQGHLRTSDPKLYQAYTSHIRPARHPEDDLKLPKLPHVRHGDDDPATELKRRRRVDAERSRRKRVKSTDLT